MTRRTQTFLVFFLPVVFGIGAAFFFGWYAFKQYESEHRQQAAAQSHDLAMQMAAGKLGHQMLHVQQELASILKQANAGQADEAAAYQVHSRIVNLLDQMDKQLGQLNSDNGYPQLRPELEAALAGFAEYRRLAVSATDIVAIEPALAGRYIDDANQRYIDFAERMLHLNSGITKQSQLRTEDGDKAIAEELVRIGITALLAYLVMISLWFFVALAIVRHLAIISDALQRLDEAQTLAPEEQSRLKKITGFLLRDLARAALAFGQTMRARKEAEGALISEKKQLTQLLRSMPDLVWFKNGEGRYVRCNPRFESFAGFPEQELLGKSDFDVFPAQDAERYHALDRKASLAESVVSEQEWRAFPDGHRELIEIFKVAVRDENGALCGVLGVGRDITAQYMAHSELQDSQANLKRTQAVAQIGSWVCDYRFNTLMGSEEAYNILGIPLGTTFTPREFFQFVDPEDRERVWAAWHATPKSGVFNVEHRIHIADQTKWVIQRAEIERNESGEATRAIGMVQDISSIKAATEALRHREEVFSAIVGQADSGIILIDIEGLQFIEFNDAACNHLGYSREEFARLSVYDIQAGLERHDVDQLVATILERGGNAFENRQRCKDGSVRDFWISVKAIEVGSCRRLSAVWTDITERKEVEKNLATSQERLEVAQSAAGVGFWETDLDSNRTWWSSETEKLYGLAPGSFAGNSDAWLKQVHPDDIAAVNHTLGEYRHRREPFEIEFRIIRSDGDLRWLSSRGRVIFADEHPVRVLGVTFDITERRLASEELENYRTRLEELVAERTLELAEARDAAQAANRSKSSFLANMSHEIRTPMNAIIGLTHMLHRDTSDARQRSQLEKISGAANHLLGIINDILDFSKIEAGKMTLESADFDVDRIVTNACTLVTNKVQEKGLELVADISALPPALTGDGLRIGQILLNFLSNAVKFTEKGSVVLRASIIAEAPPGMTVRFEVQDTGIGMTMEQCNRLFHAFEQADASTTRKFGGTGLGLTISKRLAELMGGRIGVDSKPGQGSTFWLELPLVRAAQQRRRSTPQILVHGTRTLIVDDIEDARNSLAATLRELGAVAECASAGREAIERVIAADQSDAAFSLILLDWQMPGMDGIEVAQRLLELPLQVRPVVFLVSGTLGAPSEDLAEYGLAGFIAKPMTPSSLLVALERFHDMQEQTRQEGGVDEPGMPDDFASLRQSIAGHRVLLAEDNPLNQEVALDLLNEVGLQVDVADDGLQALHLAESNDYKLILLDVQMPNMDGLEACRRIRQLPRHRNTPVVAMTANAFEEDRNTALGAGMVDHIAKPVDPQLLYRTLARWLNHANDDADTGNQRAAANPIPADAYIPGVDLTIALRSTLGNREKLNRLIERFVSNHAGDARKLEEQLEKNNPQEARLIAHSLKGTGATLGLTGISEIAATIEQGIAQGKSVAELAAAASELDGQLGQLGDDYRNWSTSHAATGLASGTSDHTGLRAELHKLRELIATDDLAALETFEHLQPRFTVLAGRSVARLGAEIEDFAYDQALATLDAILATLPQLR